MPTPDPNVRISNTDREAVIRRLHAATEEGRLELDEFAERSRQVYEAKTYAEVDRLLSDLPGENGAVAVRGDSRQRAAAPDLDLAPKHSRVVRDGAWSVPARISLKPAHSRIVLDLRDAVFTSREVEIDVHPRHARIEIILPEGASAVDDGLDFHGGRLKNGSRKQGEGPLLRLNGKLHFSRVTVRYERRFMRWRW